MDIKIVLVILLMSAILLLVRYSDALMKKLKGPK
jgi:hypothetical protein